MILEGKNIWIITGPRGVGKTRFCTSLVQTARLQGWQVEGVICPPGYSGSEKSFIEIENLQTKEHATLARVKGEETGSLQTEHWLFDEKVVSWANDFLGSISKCDLLLIDELGPLEFIRGKGWQNGLIAVDHADYRIAVIVIRPELIAKAKEHWPTARVVEIPVNMDNDTETRLNDKILFDTDSSHP